MKITTTSTPKLGGIFNIFSKGSPKVGEVHAIHNARGQKVGEAKVTADHGQNPKYKNVPVCGHPNTNSGEGYVEMTVTKVEE